MCLFVAICFVLFSVFTVFDFCLFYELLQEKNKSKYNFQKCKMLTSYKYAVNTFLCLEGTRRLTKLFLKEYQKLVCNISDID